MHIFCMLLKGKNKKKIDFFFVFVFERSAGRLGKSGSDL